MALASTTKVRRDGHLHARPDDEADDGAAVGELEPDYDGDFWADAGPGEIDTPENRREFPEVGPPGGE